MIRPYMNYDQKRPSDEYVKLANGNYEETVGAIGSMKYSELKELVDSYHPDMDQGGPNDLGHNLANALEKRYGGIDKIPTELKTPNKKPKKDISDRLEGDDLPF